MPIIAPAATAQVIWWLAKNWDKLPAIADRSKEVVGSLLKSSETARHAFQLWGSNLVWNGPDGRHVIAVVDEMRTSLTRLEIGQHITQASIEGLRGVTMISLGLSGVSVGLIAAQLAYLTNRLNTIQKEIKKVQIKIDDTQEAALRAAFMDSEQAEGATGKRQKELFSDALKRARGVGPYFSQQATNSSIHENDPRLIQYYARKYFLALSVEIGALVGLDEIPALVSRFSTERSTLRPIASLIFKHTLENRVDELMTPAFANIAPLHLIEHLYGQAADLKCFSVEGEFDIRAFIDQNRLEMSKRGGLRDFLSPDYRRFKKEAPWKIDIAAGTFEEIQRLLSWEALAATLASNGISALELKEDVRKAKEELASSPDDFMVYGIAGKSSKRRVPTTKAT